MASSDQFPGSRVYKTQGATAEVIASGGRLLVEAGGVIDCSAGSIILPGVVRQGDINLSLWDAKEVSSADSLNALTSGTNPAMTRINAGTDPKGLIKWTSGAGGADPIQWDVFPPTDLSTAFPMTVDLYSEVSSAAVNGWNVDVRFGVAGANVGSTVALTTTPGNRSISVTSGNITPNVPFMVVANPVSSTGTVSLYGARITYTKKTS